MRALLSTISSLVGPRSPRPAALTAWALPLALTLTSAVSAQELAQDSSLEDTLQTGENSASTDDSPCFFGLLPAIGGGRRTTEPKVIVGGVQSDEPKNSGSARHYGCIEPTYTFDPYWSNAGVSVKYRRKGTKGGILRYVFALDATPRLTYHIWDDDWSSDPQLRFTGSTEAMIATQRLFFSVGASRDVQSQRLRLPSQAASIESIQRTQGLTQIAAAATLGGTAHRPAGYFFAGMRIRAGAGETVVSSELVTRSRSDYEKELSLSLVSSRPLRRDEIRSLLVDGEFAVLQSAYPSLETTIFLNETVLGMRGTHYPEGHSYLGFVGREEVIWGIFPLLSLRRGKRYTQLFGGRDAWLEFHVRATLQWAATASASVFLLPSLGGVEYGMLSVPKGEFPSTRVATLGGQVGPSFLRAFVEGGWASAGAQSSNRLGFGAVVAAPRSITATLITGVIPVATAVIPQSLEITLGSSVGGAFTSTVNVFSGF